MFIYFDNVVRIRVVFVVKLLFLSYFSLMLEMWEVLELLIDTAHVVSKVVWFNVGNVGCLYILIVFFGYVVVFLIMWFGSG